MSTARRPIPYSLQVQVFRDSAWLCTWCHAPLVFAPALNLLERWVRKTGHQAPLAYFHMRWRRDASPMLDYLGAVVDHVDAFSKGGAHAKENFVASCNKCNSLKSAETPEALAAKRRLRKVRGKYGEPQHWDGLTTVFVLLAAEHPQWLTVSERKWLKALTEAIGVSSLARSP